MTQDMVWLLTAGIALIAILYSCVGHAGASGYIAVMSLLSIAPGTIKPTALALNILVASIATVQFYRAGHFRWSLFWPFAVCAVPMAYLGGAIKLPVDWLKILLGSVLLFSAARFVWPERVKAVQEAQPPHLALALVTGAVLGLLAGMTGTGGGIFLTPLLLLMGWALPKNAAAVSALFILVNSMAGLAGSYSTNQPLPPYIPYLMVAALIGGVIGSTLGSRKFDPSWIKRILSVVLLIAGSKLIFG